MYHKCKARHTQEQYEQRYTLLQELTQNRQEGGRQLRQKHFCHKWIFRRIHVRTSLSGYLLSALRRPSIMGKCTTLDSKLFGKEQEIVSECTHSGHILIIVRLYRQNLDLRLNNAIRHLKRLYDNWPNSPRPLWFLTEEELRRLWVRSQSETGILPAQSPCTGPLGGFS